MCEGDVRSSIATSVAQGLKDLFAGVAVPGTALGSTVLRRLLRWIAMPAGWRRCGYPLGLSLAYHGRVWRFKIRGFDPERRFTLRNRRRKRVLEHREALLARI